ncbi:MAG: hypothetical protein U9Q15_00870 [Patescibacteria group bacterium]|nr:hypothetical protein [Patescibacteria group bacterium]
MSGYIWSENMGWVEIGGFSSTASGGIGTGYNAMVDAGAFRPDNTVPSASISTPSSSGSYFSGSFMDFAGTFYDTDSGVDGSTALYTIIPGNITGALLTAGDVGTTENFSTGIVFADLGMTDGSYEISVSTDDVVGNTQISTTATTFHIDTIGPESDSFSIDG